MWSNTAVTMLLDINYPIIQAPMAGGATTAELVAAGGIIDGNDIFSMLQQGAAAVQMGSAFLVCPEAGIPPLHKNAILALSADDTLLTRAFTGRVARSIRNRFIEEMSEHEDSLLDFPLQGACTKDIRSAAHNSSAVNLCHYGLAVTLIVQQRNLPHS